MTPATNQTASLLATPTGSWVTHNDPSNGLW